MATKTSTGQTQGGTAALEMLESGVAVVRLGHPDEKLIILTAERMTSIRTVLAYLKDNVPKGLIFVGPSADMFTAGADINVIRDIKDAQVGESLAVEGQKLFEQIAALPYPTVAAISGPCMGGGCEMVLACKVRLISDQKSSAIGLPEIKLGILPGFGGTQRLPRLIGLPKALDIILAGKTLRPKQALAVGLVDEIVAAHKLRERAEAIVLEPAKLKRKKLGIVDRLLTYTAFGRRMVQKNALAQVQNETKGFYPAPPAALECALYGLVHGVEEGQRREARELGRLAVTSESKSLVKIFFLTEQAKSIGKSARKAVEHIQAIVIGAGAMGAGIAGVLAKNECSIVLKDTTDEALQRGMKQVRENLAKVKSLSEAERSFVINRIEATTRDSSTSGNANLVIEAVFEELGAKKKVLSDACKQVAPDVIIATNTSSLSVTEIASTIENPDRVVGMHFFNPVEKMPLVEIVRGAQTSDRTVAVIAALTTKIGKYPIVVSDVPGFLINRTLFAYLREAAYLLQDGYRIADVDKAATSFGMPMGPIRLLDEVGLDIASHVSETMIKGYGARMQGPALAATLVAAGRKGKKNGAGFYDFQGKESTPSPRIRALLKIDKPERSVTDLKPLTDRLILSLINEAVRCLDEGVAGAPSPEAANQIDLGTVMGIGFPPFRGGLLHYADSLGADRVLQLLTALEKEHGSRFSPAPGIVSRAKKGKKFSEKST